MLSQLYRRVRRFPAFEVGRRDRETEVDPASVGMSKEGVDAIWKATSRLYETRMHPAVSICIRRRGQVVLHGSLGHLRGNGPDDRLETPKALASPSSLFCLFSASKAITATVIHLLDERGALHIDDPVAETIPEFARHGKGEVTIRHLLTHTAGLAQLGDVPISAELIQDWSLILDILCNAQLESRPGHRLSYHALTAGFLLAEVAYRATGRPIRELLQTEILDPLGIPHLNYGLPREARQRLARNEDTGAPMPWPMRWFVTRALGVRMREAVAISNDPRFLDALVPSGNIVGNADGLSRFYQWLLDESLGRGPGILQPRTVRRALLPQNRFQPDATLLVPIRYSLGFILGERRLSFYGPESERAFGHLGLTSVLGYADQERDISVALLTSGKSFLQHGHLAWLEVTRAIAAAAPRDVDLEAIPSSAAPPPVKRPESASSQGAAPEAQSPPPPADTTPFDV